MKKRSTGRIILFSTISMLIVLLAVLLTGEVLIRLYHLIRYDNNVSTVAIDDQKGWVNIPNYRFEGYRTDFAQNPYDVLITTNENGFRSFGNPESDSARMLVIGDSFTHAMEVSDDQTFFHLLGEELGFEIFGIGVGGYGTLQEYMLLDQWIDHIKPDVILLQFSTNDFINNHYGMEFRHFENNNRMRRPYLEHGEIVYRTPTKLPAFRNFINNYSKFLYFIASRMDRIKAGMQAGEAAPVPGEDDGDGPDTLYQEAVAVTDRLLGMIRNRVPDEIPVFVFCVDQNEPYYADYKVIAGNNGLIVIDGVPERVREASRQDMVTRYVDGAHWNALGHQLAAEVLAGFFRDYYDNDPAGAPRR